VASLVSATQVEGLVRLLIIPNQLGGLGEYQIERLSACLIFDLWTVTQKRSM
jgi:hypothetical protein